MLRTVLRLTPSFVIPIFQNRPEYDYDILNTQKTRKPETGWERVKNMYTPNEFDEYTVELHTVVQSSLCGAFAGAVLGGFARSRIAYLYFIENNQASIFKSTMQAKKKLQDYVLIAFAKGAYKWGWRLGIFTGIFTTKIGLQLEQSPEPNDALVDNCTDKSGIATTISVYRDDTSLVEYVAAGTLTGGLHRIHMGLAATIVGAGLGAALSTIAGLLVLGILKASGVTMNDIRKTLHKIKEAREEQYKQAVDKASEIKNDSLIQHHDIIVQERGEKTLREL